MLTLFDIESRLRDLKSFQRAAGVAPGWTAKPVLKFPGGGSVALPRSLEGLEIWESARPTSGPLSDHRDGEVCRAVLACAPTFVMRLPDPTPLALAGLGEDSTVWRRESATRFVAAVAVDSGDAVVYGLARSIVIENKLGFGQAAYLQHEEVWFESLAELADALALQVGDSEGVQLSAEAGSKPWVEVALLLTNQNEELELPANWVYHLEVVAGLFAVNLRVHRNAGSATRQLLKEIRSSAPHGLLVSARSVPTVEVFFAAHEGARAKGYRATLGDREADDFSDYLTELTWHMQALRRASGGGELAEDCTWREAAKAVRDLTGDHFVLSKRANDSLKDNPYPDPKRMHTQLAGLAGLAESFHQSKGQLGRRLEDAAVEFGIEIALFDDSMPNLTVAHCGREHSSKPHVKVDDVKDAAECGRIYFGLDTECWAFIVGHVGLHDYY